MGGFLAAARHLRRGRHGRRRTKHGGGRRGAFRTSPIEAELTQSNYEIMRTRWRCYRGEEIVLERRLAVAP